MNVYFDTEFTGLHKDTTLISIGLIAEDGSTFYAELTDYDKTQLDDWLNTNVITNLKYNDKEIFYDKTDDNVSIKNDKYIIAKELREWLSRFEYVEMWSDCLAYDWVLFNDLFNIPKNVFYIPFDICTAMRLGGVDPDVNREQYAQVVDNVEKHNALFDAIVIKKCFERLV